MRVFQNMNPNAWRCVWVNGQYREEVGVEVVVHQGSVLKALLIILLLEALSREFHIGEL